MQTINLPSEMDKTPWYTKAVLQNIYTKANTIEYSRQVLIQNSLQAISDC